MDIRIISILELDEVRSLMKAQLELTVSWFDPRLEFVDLNADRNNNTIPMSQKLNMWLPEMIFNNTQAKTEAMFHDEFSFASVELSTNYFIKEFRVLNWLLF